MRRANSIQYGYRKCGTPTRVLATTLAHVNKSKSKPMLFDPFLASTVSFSLSVGVYWGLGFSG